MQIVCRVGLVLLSLVAAAGCRPEIAVAEYPLAAAVPQQCRTQCESVGLAFDAMVVMGQNVGCVCRARADMSPAATARAGAGGVAAFLVTMEEQRKREEEQRKTEEAQRQTEEQQQRKRDEEQRQREEQQRQNQPQPWRK